MSDEINMEGKEYVSSKRASELSGYTQDYIGQLARGGHVSAQRVGGLWYIAMESLEAYKVHADEFKPEPPKHSQLEDSSTKDSLVSFDGRNYISAAYAAKVTGYHQDYVGQLARSGKIASRQVGNRWYVDRSAIVAHKAEKDALLGAVQAQSVGIKEHDTVNDSTSYTTGEPFYTYTSDVRDPLPALQGYVDDTEDEDAPQNSVRVEANQVPIRVLQRPPVVPPVNRNPGAYVPKNVRRNKNRTHGKTMFYATTAGLALTVIVVLSLGVKSLKMSSIYTSSASPLSHTALDKNAFVASAAAAVGRAGDILENILSTELVYRKVQ